MSFKSYLFAILATVIVLSSCSITTHIHFNKDNSGTVKVEINYSEMMAEMDDSTKTNFRDSIMTPFNDMSGLEKLKNYKMEFKGNSLIMSYDFANIDELNTSLSTMENGENADKKDYVFSSTKKGITYTSKKKDEESAEGEDDMAAMFPVIFKVSYEKKISKCSNSSYKVSTDKKSMEFTGNAGDFVGDKMNFTVKLK